VLLELARSGADVAGVVSFHGGLDRNIFRTSGKSHGYQFSSAGIIGVTTQTIGRCVKPAK
jgi:hypothetical protein